MVGLTGLPGGVSQKNCITTIHIYVEGLPCWCTGIHLQSECYSDRPSFSLPFMRRQCVVVGPAEYHKKITSLSDIYMQRETLLVYLNTISEDMCQTYSHRPSSSFAMFAEAMCSGWSGGAS